MAYTTTICLIAAAASLASAQTTVFEYRLGENDPSPSNNGFVSSTRLADGGTSNQLTRWSGNANPQYSNVTPDPVTTQWSMSFSGTNSGLYTAENFFGATSDNLAIEAWIQPDSSSGTRPILYVGEQGVNGFGLYQSSGFVFGQLIDTGDTLRAIGTGGGATTAPTDGTWTHVGLVRDAGTWNVYVNGAIAGNARAETATAPAEILTLGTWNDGGGITSSNFTDFFDGRIDNIRGFTFDDGTFSTSMFDYPASAIPEPSHAVILFGAGVLAIGLLRLRKRA